MTSQYYYKNGNLLSTKIVEYTITLEMIIIYITVKFTYNGWFLHSDIDFGNGFFSNISKNIIDAMS